MTFFIYHRFQTHPFTPVVISAVRLSNTPDHIGRYLCRQTHRTRRSSRGENSGPLQPSLIANTSLSITGKVERSDIIIKEQYGSDDKSLWQPLHGAKAIGPRPWKTAALHDDGEGEGERGGVHIAATAI